MKTLSSLELHYIEKELSLLENTKVDKIFVKGKEELLFQLHKTGVGKKLLRVLIGKSLFMSESKPDMEEPGGFCMQLRKYLNGAFLKTIAQIKPERIIQFVFDAKQEQYTLYIEFFGKGNVILCKEKNTIINALYHHTFKDRKVAPKETYIHPTMDTNVFSLSVDQFSTLLQKTTRESLVKSLAIDLGLGGQFSEEICHLSTMDKKAKPKDVDDKQTETIHQTLTTVLKKKINPVVYSSSDEVQDILPYPLETVKGKTTSFSTLSEALEHYYSHFFEKPKTQYDKKVEAIQRIVEQQEKNIKKLQKEEENNREKAEIIYSNYQQLKNVLDELKEIEKKHSWQDIRKKLKGHKLIVDVNAKEKSITVDV